MGLLLKLAIRNVHRSSKFTLLNGIGITIAVIILLIIFSLSRGIEAYIVSNTIKFETGAVTIDLNKTLISKNKRAMGDSLIADVQKAMNENPGIAGYSYRVYPPNTLLYLKDNTQAINLIGVDTAEMSLATRMFKILSSGKQAANRKTIMISDGIANEYNLKVGDVCNIMLQSVDGTINLEDYVITKVFRYTSLVNKYNVYMDYEEAKSLYNSNLPSKILINVKDITKATEIRDELRKKLKSEVYPKYSKVDSLIEVSSYEDHIGMARSLSSFNRYGMMSIAFFLILISFVGVWSMQTENKAKRKRETGTLLSFGFTDSSIRKIYLYESLYISSLYTLIGVFLVVVIVTFISLNHGIYLGESASFAFGSSIVLPLLTVNDVIVTAAISILYPLLATLLSISGGDKNIVNMLKQN